MSKGMSVFFHFRIWSRSLAHKEDIETEESSYRNAIHNEVPPEVLKLHTSCWVFTQAGLLPSKGQRRVSRTCLVCPFQVTISEMYGICGKTCFIHPNGKRTYTKDKGAFVTACVACFPMYKIAWYVYNDMYVFPSDSLGDGSHFLHAIILLVKYQEQRTTWLCGTFVSINDHSHLRRHEEQPHWGKNDYKPPSCNAGWCQTGPEWMSCVQDTSHIVPVDVPSWGSKRPWRGAKAARLGLALSKLVYI